MIVLLFLSLLLLIAIIVITIFYLRMRSYRSQLLIEKETKTQKDTSHSDEDMQRLQEWAFKIELVTKSGKTRLWDYNAQKDQFYYPEYIDSVFKGFSWNQYIELVHPDDRQIADQMMRNLLENKQDTIHYCYRLHIPESTNYLWFDTIAVVYKRDETGKPLIVSGLRWDITDSILEKQQLEDNKALLDLTISTGGIIPWIFDVESLKMSSDNKNSVFCQHDYTIYQYIDKLVHPDQQALFREKIDRMLSLGEQELNIKVQTRYKNKYEWTHIIGKFVMTPRTHERKAIGISRFITEEVEKQEELISLRKVAEKSNYQKTAFLANMSHEIRTPLNAIVGFSNLISQTTDPEEVNEYMRIIETNNELLLQLINDILDISKIEAGQMVFNFNETDLCVIFSDISQSYMIKIPADVNLVCEIPDDSYLINTERNRFTQVISNFLNNAIKFTTQGSITMGYEHWEKGIRFYVRDTGKGIKKENLSHIFDRFTKFDSHISGTGLGMAISKSIVKILGGEIGVDSELGKGSEFWFTIPYSKLKK